MSLSDHFKPDSYDQLEKLPGSRGARQVKNNAGGQVFEVSCWTALNRFLILGTVGGTYYVSERKATHEAATVLDTCIVTDLDRTIGMIVKASVDGRAIKNDFPIFALAYIAGKKGDIGNRAFAELSKVARIGTHLFQFIEAVLVFRGKGRSYHRAITNWYIDKGAKRVAYQSTKYQKRHGWSHRDVLRTSRPSVQDRDLDGVFAYITKKDNWTKKIQDPEVLEYLIAVEKMKTASPKEAASLVRAYKLVREHVPTELLNEKIVWGALMEDMPYTALLRNLGKITSIGLLKPLDSLTKHCIEILADETTIKNARCHPMTILQAWKVYRAGQGIRGTLTWKPQVKIAEALEQAFYLSFNTITPSLSNFYIGLDVSGSMNVNIANSCLTCREAAAVMSMVTVRTEPFCYIGAFTSRTHSIRRRHTQLEEFPVGKESSLQEVIRASAEAGRRTGGTDCALPMLDALEKELEIDTFVIFTDSETYSGNVHPCVALDQYRQKMGRPSKLIVVGMTSTGFSIADPEDPNTLDVVGFDTSTPRVISTFGVSSEA